MNYDRVINEIAEVSNAAQSASARAINQMLTLRNWLIGAYIVEFEQSGEDRAAYGEQLLKTMAEDLSRRGHNGFSETNLKYFRQFALAYPSLAIGQTLSDQFKLLIGSITQSPDAKLSSPQIADADPFCFPSLEARYVEQQVLFWQDEQYYARLFGALSWSHLLELARIDDPTRRAFYELECLKSRWSLRELKRQINSLLYERVGLSKDKDAVMALTREGRLPETPSAILRDPYVLEFLGLEERTVYTESELEQALIDHLEKFMRELGRDFCFMDRQFRITVAGRHHYLDLLFYHRALRCLVAIDLKLGAFQHEHAGQMNFYLNYLKENVAYPDENPPVGILLCAEKDAEEVHFATAGMDRQLFVSRYLVALPSEERLKQWLREEQQYLQSVMDAEENQ